MREVKKEASIENIYIDEIIKKQCSGTLCESALSSVQICWVRLELEELTQILQYFRCAQSHQCSSSALQCSM